MRLHYGFGCVISCRGDGRGGHNDGIGLRIWSERGSDKRAILIFKKAKSRDRNTCKISSVEPNPEDSSRKKRLHNRVFKNA